MEKMICLVIGGCGMIGSQLVRDLVANGYFVRVFDRDASHFSIELQKTGLVEVVEGDLSNYKLVGKLLIGVSVVIHSAYTTVPSNSMDDLEYDLKSNILPLINLLQLICANSSIKRFIYFSSGGTVYGNQKEQTLIDESYPTLPVSSYGLTKLMSEQYIRLLVTDSSLHTYILRISNAYGIGFNISHPQGVIGHFLNAVSNRLPITIYGNGNVIRDYIYTSDVSNAVNLCIEDCTAIPGKVNIFNLGSSIGTSIYGIMQIIESVVNKELVVGCTEVRSFDCNYNVLDCTRIRDNLGWAPRVELKDGIVNMWNWIQENSIVSNEVDSC